jgi:hypothetical protein
LSNAFFENLSVRFESCLPSFTIHRPASLNHWIKVKNRNHPALDRVMEAFA